MERNYFKVVCEVVDNFRGKIILVDEDCLSLDEVHKIVEESAKKHPEFIAHDKLWLMYPMTSEITQSLTTAR